MKKRIGFGRRVLLCALLLASALTSVRAADEPRTVRVGYYEMANFQEYDKTSGLYRGYSYDYMLAVAQYAGWQYEFVPVTYDEGLQMLEDGRLDLMNNVAITDELSRQLAYSALPSGSSCTCLVVPQDNTSVAYEDFSSIGSLTVGLDYASSLNSGFVDYCKDNDCMPTLIYYHTASGVAGGLASGEIDACLASSLQDVAMRTVAKFDTRSYYFATTKGNSDLLQELNTAMNSLKTSDPYFEEKVYAKYHGKSSEEQTVISQEEAAYVADAAPIKVVYDPSWYPISYTDEHGRFCGAMASLLDSVSERTGLRFSYVRKDTAAEALESLRSGEAQVMAGFPYDYTWAQAHNARVTTPFVTLTMFAACRADSETGGAYAVPAGSYLRYLSQSLRQEGYSYQEYASTDACLRAVLNGDADFAFLDSYQLEYYRGRSDYRKLSYKVLNGDDYGLSLAVSDTADGRLFSILEKALSAAGSDQIGNILRQTSLSASSRSIIDTFYANPRAAGLMLMLFGFLAAVVISALVYTHALNRKNLQLKAAVSAKSEFLSNMSHDMRTPLNGIIGYTELARKTDVSAQKEDYLRKIQISGEFLLNLINDTLDVSKIESGKFTLKPEPVDTEELLAGIIVPIRQMADAKGIRFAVDTAGMTGGTILADRLNLQKIILNLLSNAVKFTPAGGTVTLTIAALAPQEDGRNALVTVEDTGIGISEEFIGHIFEPFSQERAPEGGNTAGTGLGLSIVKSVVELMGGRIEVRSRRGEGTRFDVRLPITHLSGEAARPAEPAADLTLLRGRRALLCEDNEMNREIATAVLQSFGMEVCCAENGRAGADRFAASEPGEYDVVLMDLRMPVLDGFGAARAIRALPRADASTVPILAMSADAYEEDLRKCREAGMNGHIAKPVDTKRLFAELVKCCGRRGEDT